MPKTTENQGIILSHNVEGAALQKLSLSHCHDTYELLFVMEGSGKYVVEGREFALTARSVMIAKPLEYHYVVIDTDAKYERYIMRFSDSDLIEGAGKALSAFLDGETNVRCFCFSGEVSDTIVSIFEHSKIAMTLPDEYAESYKRMILAELIMLFSVARTEDAYTFGFEIGARVIQYLNEHINRDINLDFLSKKFFVSKYYLCRVFKKHNGISIHGYITQKRIMLAKQMIESGESARGAAYKVGYRDYSVFYRAFVKVLGVPPLSTRNVQEKNYEE